MGSLGELARVGAHLELAAIGHSVNRVHDKVNEYLLNLVLVHVHQGQLRFQVLYEGYLLFRKGMTHQAQGFFDQLVQVGGRNGQLVRGGKLEQPARDRIGPVNGFLHVPQDG